MKKIGLTLVAITICLSLILTGCGQSPEHRFNVGDRFPWYEEGAYATILDVGMFRGELYYTYTVTKGDQIIGPQSSLVSLIDKDYLEEARGLYPNETYPFKLSINETYHGRGPCNGVQE